MEVCIITLKESPNHKVKTIFPDAIFFKAIDLRKQTAQDLFNKNIITLNAFENLTNGRKYHHELSDTGAVGLHQSFLAALKNGDKNKPILIFENKQRRLLRWHPLATPGGIFFGN